MRRWLRQIALGLGLAAAAAPLLAQAPSTPIDLALPWVEVTPDQVGLDAAQLEVAAARAAQQPRTRCLLVARHGKLAFERYAAGYGVDSLFDVRSVTKSVVSLLTGIALRDGILPGLDVSIAPYLAPHWRVDTQDAAVTVRHLLTMTSGFEWDESASGGGYNAWILSRDPVQYVLDRRHVAPPGQRWTYNSGAVHILGVLLQQAAARPLPELAQARLFEPLGITPVVWEAMPDATVNGGAGIDLRARDLLKLGQLTLQQGQSGQTSVVPAAWVAESTRPAVSWRTTAGPFQGVGYGSLWWTEDPAPAAFFAWGYGGQFIYVVPSLELVVVTTTRWGSLSEITPDELEAQMLAVIESVTAAALPTLR